MSTRREKLAALLKPTLDAAKRFKAKKKAAKKKAKPIMEECTYCDGTGHRQKTCNGCGVELDSQNVAGNWPGYDEFVDDVCKACQKSDDDYADVHSNLLGAESTNYRRARK